MHVNISIHIHILIKRIYSKRCKNYVVIFDALVYIYIYSTRCPFLKKGKDEESNLNVNQLINLIHTCFFEVFFILTKQDDVIHNSFQIIRIQVLFSIFIDLRNKIISHAKASQQLLVILCVVNMSDPRGKCNDVVGYQSSTCASQICFDGFWDFMIIFESLSEEKMACQLENSRF